MIYVDPPRPFPGKRKKYSHLMADTIEELHDFAAMIRVKRHWFDKDHYDIREEEFARAVDEGAQVVRPRFLAELRKK